LAHREITEINCEDNLIMKYLSSATLTTLTHVILTLSDEQALKNAASAIQDVSR